MLDARRDASTTLRLGSASLLTALQDLVGDWRLSEHDFAAQGDEVHMSCDAGGSAASR